MNRTVILAAAAAALCGSANAQNSVELYGRVNTTVERVKKFPVDENGVKAGKSDTGWSMLNNSSRIGLRGTEDIAGGLKAGFILEHGFDSTDGTQSSSAFWNRYAELDLISDSAGMVRLGLFGSAANDATADWISLHNHDTGRSADKLFAYVVPDTHKVAYRTPTLGNFWAEGGVTLSEATASPGDKGNRTYEAAVNYNDGPLSLGAGFTKNGDIKAAAARILYEIGPFMVGGYVQRDASGFGEGLGRRDSNVRLVGMYTVGANEIHVNVGRASAYKNLDDSDGKQFTLTLNHNLSKRTKVYTYFTKIVDDAGLYGYDSQSLAVGVRHNF